MKLKMSLFNKAVIRSDLKRFWWVGALYAIILFISLPLRFMLLLLPLEEEWQKEEILSGLHLEYGSMHYSGLGGINIQVLLICILPVLLAVMLFSYLHSTRAAAMQHSLPLKRITLLGSHTTSGILIISAPVLLTAVILSVLALFTGYGEYYSIVNVTEWTGLTLLFDIVFFSVAVFVGMFTGNAAAHVVFTYIINVLPYGLYVLVAYNIERLLNGFSANVMNVGWEKAMPLVNVAVFQLARFSLIQGLVYLAVAAIFLVGAGLVYKVRNLEAAGNIIAFRAIQPVFKYGVTLCFMLLGGIIFGIPNHQTKAATIAAYFIFAVAGYWIAQTLLEKTVKVWHAYKGFLIYAACAVLLVSCILTDIAGYTKYVPRIDEVKGVYFGYSYIYWKAHDENALPESKSSPASGFYSEEKNIKAVMSLQRILAESGNDHNGTEKYIVYKMKNGRSIIRKYIVDEESVRGFLAPIYESLEYKRNEYPVLDQHAQDIKMIEVGDHRTSKKPLILSDTKLMQSFINSMKKELVNADYEEIIGDENSNMYIRITGMNNNESHYYILKRSYTSLFSWLKDNGYYESVILVPEDIDHVNVQILELKRYAGGGYGYSGENSRNTNMDIKDKSMIGELIGVYDSATDRGKHDKCLQLQFYGQGGTEVAFTGFIYPDTPVREELRKELGKLGMDF